MGHEHNRMVAWVRLWGAIGTCVYAESTRGDLREIAQDLANYEIRRYNTACYALGTTAAIDDQNGE